MRCGNTGFYKNAEEGTVSKFRIARYQIQMSNGIAGPRQPFSAVLLSDLHNASYGDGNHVLLQAIRDEEADFARSVREGVLGAAAGAVPAVWLVVRRCVNRAGNTGVRRWASIAFAVLSAVAFIGIGYVAIVGGLLSPSVSY